MAKVSVIIPVYNKGKYVAEAVESALGQTYADTEIVCIDDCSTDNSYEVLKGLADKYKHIVLLKNEENKGVIYSRNTAIEAATGEYILPLDADDIIEPTYVEKAAKVLDSRPDIGIVYCQYKFIGKQSKVYKTPKFSEKYLLFSSCISSCSMFRKKDFQKIGGFKDCMKHGCEDWELWLNFYENGYKFYLIDDVMLYYRKIEEETRTTIQNNNLCDIRKELIKNHLNLYFNNSEFMKKVFELDIKEFKEHKKKHMKYRKLFNFQTCISISLLILFVVTMLL